MNPRVTLGLLAVLVALGGYVYFAGPSASATQPAGPAGKDKGAVGKEKAADEQLEVWRLEEREIQRLAIQKGVQQTVVQKDPSGEWSLQPSGEPADRLRINGLLLRLATLRATRRFGEPGNLADYGLATPESTVTIRQSDGTEYTLELGGKAPAEAGTYARRSDAAAVFVVSNAIVQDLERLLTEPPRQPTPTPVPPETPTPVESTPSPTPAG
jgi:hypothetical protein